MGLELNFDEGQTPIDEDEKLGLKIRTIAKRRELDEFEQNNIEKAIQWTLKNRFKHRLVSIHLFPNGNGRHSRLVADVIVSHIFKKPVFTWGSAGALHKIGSARQRYIHALRKADIGNLEPLIEFSRS